MANRLGSGLAAGWNFLRQAAVKVGRGLAACQRFLHHAAVKVGRVPARWLERLGSNPYVALYEVAPGFDHTAIAVRKVKGLLYLQALVTPHGATPQEGRLLTAWRDQAAFDAARATFPTQAGLPAGTAPGWEGLQRDVRESTPIWRKFVNVSNVWAAVATLFVILGYAEKARDASGWLLGKARVEVAEIARPVDVLAGDPLDFDVQVKNARSLGDCAVTFAQPAVEAQGRAPAGGIRLDALAETEFPGIKPNAREPLHVSGQALYPGEYRVVVKGEAKAGLFARRIQFQGSRRVKVWAAVAIGQRQLGKNTWARYAEIDVELLPGRSFPSGLDVEAKLERVPGVQLLGVRFPGTNQFDPPAHNWDTPGEEVATLVWRTPAVEPKRPIWFTLMLGSQADHTEKEWTVLSRRLLFGLSEAR